MTQGYSRPFTPQGNASLVPALPWHFGGDLLLVHFKADPSALAALLPAPLTAATPGDEAFLWSPNLRCYPHGLDAAKLNPYRTHYNVCVVGIPCMFQGKRSLFSTFQWGDRDWLVAVSWFLGACSKYATIDQSGVHPLVASSEQTGGVGSHIVRTVSRHGEKIVQMSFSPQERVGIDAMQFYFDQLPLICMRHFPDIHVPPVGRPLVHDLTQMVMTDTRFGEVLRGPADLRFFASDNEDLLPIQPTKVLGGYWIPMGFNLHGIRVVHDYLK